MKKHHSIHVVRDIARMRADGLATQVGSLMRERENANEILDRLSEFAADYSVSHGGPRGARSLENRHRFVEKLFTALDRQRVQMERIEARTDHTEATWRRACADVDALDRLLERRADAERDVEESNEQRETDAFSMRSHHTRNADQG